MKLLSWNSQQEHSDCPRECRTGRTTLVRRRCESKSCTSLRGPCSCRSTRPCARDLLCCVSSGHVAEVKGKVRMQLSTPSDATPHTPRMPRSDAASMPLDAAPMPLDAAPMPLDAGSPTVQRCKKCSSSTAYGVAFRLCKIRILLLSIMYPYSTYL